MAFCICCSVLTHLDKAGSTVKICFFFHFSSVFNTIQPMLLSDKLQQMHVDLSTISWITDYLTDKSQSVQLRNCVGTIGEQHKEHRSPIRDSPVSFPLHPVQVAPGGAHCGVVWDESSASECGKDDGDGGGLQKG